MVHLRCKSISNRNNNRNLLPNAKICKPPQVRFRCCPFIRPFPGRIKNILFLSGPVCYVNVLLRRSLFILQNRTTFGTGQIRLVSSQSCFRLGEPFRRALCYDHFLYSWIDEMRMQNYANFSKGNLIIPPRYNCVNLFSAGSFFKDTLKWIFCSVETII